MTSNESVSSKIELAPHIKNSRYGYSRSASGQDFLFLAGYEKCSEHYDLHRDSFPYLILELIISGSGRLTLPRKEVYLGPGDCFCWGLNTPCRLRTNPVDPLEKYFIAFGAGSHSRRLEGLPLYPGYSYKCDDLAIIEKWSRLILEECAAQDDDSPENVSALVNILLRKLAPYSENADASSRTDALVLKAIRTIENDFQTISSIQELAGKLQVTREHLCRSFKKAGRSSPYKTLTRRKMEHAFTQLKLTQLPIQDIALNLGFSDAFHFSRAFKNQYGHPPSQAREL
ncbi:MAG: AraC family transcriptional regulator [Verrucomicrobiota bacterium]